MLPLYCGHEEANSFRTGIAVHYLLIKKMIGRSLYSLFYLLLLIF